MSLPVTQGLRFNGLTDYVQIGQPVPGFGLHGGYEMDFTLLQPAANGSYLIGSNTNTRTYVSISNGSLFATKGNPGVGIASNVYVLDGNRHTASLFWSSGIGYLYVDGILQGTASFPDTSDGSQCRMAAQTFSGGNCNMKIYAYRQYNRMPYPEEVAANYNGQVTREGLVGEWLMNEGTGTIAHDTSGNGNDGTITGATWAIKKATTVQSKVKPKKNYVDYAGQVVSPTQSPQDSVIKDSDYIYYNGVSGGYGFYFGNNIPVKRNTSYTFKANMNLLSGSFGSTYGLRVYFVQTNTYSSAYPGSMSFNSGENDSIRLMFYAGFALTGPCSLQVPRNTIQLEQGSTATQFEPYQLVPDNKAAVQVKPAAR